MRLIWIFVIAAALTACGTAAKPTTQPAHTGTTAPKIDYKAQYLTIADPYNKVAAEALPAMETWAYTGPNSLTAFASLADPLIEALQTFDNRMLRSSWPADVTQDVKTHAAAAADVIGILSAATDQNELTIDGWLRSIPTAASRMSTAANIIRSDLGLPPPV